MTSASSSEIVRRLHASGYRMVMAVTGGGTGGIADLLSIPGGSRTLLEAVVPYSPAALTDFLHMEPEQACSPRTASAMAMAAYRRALLLAETEDRKKTAPLLPTHQVTDSSAPLSVADMRMADSPVTDPRGSDRGTLLGVGLTASLVSDRPKKGDHRIHLAIQSLERAAHFTVTLRKGARDRTQEERLAAELLLRSVHDFILWSKSDDEKSKPVNGFLFHVEESDDYFGEPDRPSFIGREPLFPDEKVKAAFLRAAPALGELLFDNENQTNTPFLPKTADAGPLFALHCQGNRFQKIDRSEISANLPEGIFPGSFNPIHRGHVKMIETARIETGVSVDLEIAVVNADKPPLDFFGIYRRLTAIEKKLPNQTVWLTGFPFFWQKADFFGPTLFILGADTLKRLISPSYYGGTESGRDAVLRQILSQRCHFLLFVRPEEGNIRSMTNLAVPSFFAQFCQEIPAALFLDDISSTILRKNGDFLI